MNEHVTSNDLHAFRTRQLPPQRVVAVARHLESCDACAALASSQASATAWIDAVDVAEEHPSAVAYVDGTLSAEEQAEVEEHLAQCAICREDVDDLRSLREEERPRSRWLPVAAAVAVVLAGLAVVFSDREDTPSPRPGPIDRRPQAAVPVPAYANASWAALVREARERGIVPLPDLMALRPEEETYRGQSGTRVAGAFAPSREVVESARPRFIWPARKGARYIVSVFANGDRVAQSASLTRTEWQPERDLPRGVLLTWQVAAGELILPAPPDPPVMFRIAAEAAIAEVEQARRTHGGDHLLLGLLYARHGMLARAEEELERHGDRRLVEIVRNARH